MRKTCLILTIAFSIPFSVYARSDRDFSYAIQYGATAKFTVQVVDDAKIPIGGVKIEARFAPAFNVSGKIKSFITNTNGVAEVCGRTGGSVAIRATQDGYYGSEDEIGYIALGQGVKGNKWGSSGISVGRFMPPPERLAPCLWPFERCWTATESVCWSRTA